MDGFTGSCAPASSTDGWATRSLQRTLANPIGCVGTGLHSGRAVRLDLYPATAGSGIVFSRSDLAGSAPVAARFDAVVDTRLCSVIGAPGVTVGTVEHLMAAFCGSGIDNARVVLDGPEVPILDGSANPFLFLIDCAGSVVQPVARQEIDVLRPIRVAHGASWAELWPADAGSTGLELELTIDFAASAIGRQTLALRLTAENFRRELAAARTFTQAAEIASLHEAGLARGGSLDNAIVVDGDTVLNPGGLRMPDEFVRHKLLDVVGDLALAGRRLRGRFVAHCTGHALNNGLVRALMRDASAWRVVDATEPSAWLSAA